MSWAGFTKVNLAGLGDLAGAVNKQLQDSVKKLEKNFDTALGFDGLTADGTPVTSTLPSPATVTSADPQPSTSTDKSSSDTVQELSTLQQDPARTSADAEGNGAGDEVLAVQEVSSVTHEDSETAPDERGGGSEKRTASQSPGPAEEVEVLASSGVTAAPDDARPANVAEPPTAATAATEQAEEASTGNAANAVSHDSNQTTVFSNGVPFASEDGNHALEDGNHCENGVLMDQEPVSATWKNTASVASPPITPASNATPASPQERKPFPTGKPGKEGGEVERLQAELQAMEASVLQAAKQAQTKAEEIARLGTVIDELKLENEQLKQKSSDQTELEALREEFQTRQGAAERKIYALTKERDMLRREVNRKSDASTLIKEKDEIIKQVMAEGEELSKKQAAQEGTMRKLRSQIKELEAEKDRLTSRIAVEEAKVEGLVKDKVNTEEHLREALERSQAELETQKEFYTAKLAEAQEQLAKAEVAADSAARSESDRKLKEATEREQTLVRNLEELREAITRTTQQAAYREDMLRRDLEDLQQRCQAAEARHEELLARVPESTRPLLRQIEALQEAAANRSESWSAVERSLNIRLQEAEGKAAGAQERERAANERLSQSVQRLAVMEAQLMCVRTEQAQLTRSLEKERQRSSEHRQEVLSLQEALATQDGRCQQFEEELKDLRAKLRKEAQEHREKQEGLQQEIERLQGALREAERRPLAPQRSSLGERGATSPLNAAAAGPPPEEPRPRHLRRLSSSSSIGSVEESAILQHSLQWPSRPPTPQNHEHFGSSRGLGGPNTVAVAELESLLRQKEGEQLSHLTRLRQLESTRDSLAEELVKTTTQCEALRAEAALLPGLRAELESVRKRHASALELMGERDEQVEELRMDLLEHKEMYRQQVDLLVGQIERLSKQIGKS